MSIVNMDCGMHRQKTEVSYKLIQLWKKLEDVNAINSQMHLRYLLKVHICTCSCIMNQSVWPTLSICTIIYFILFLFSLFCLVFFARPSPYNYQCDTIFIVQVSAVFATFMNQYEYGTYMMMYLLLYLSHSTFHLLQVYPNSNLSFHFSLFFSSFFFVSLLLILRIL